MIYGRVRFLLVFDLGIEFGYVDMGGIDFIGVYRSILKVRRLEIKMYKCLVVLFGEKV